MSYFAYSSYFSALPITSALPQTHDIRLTFLYHAKRLKLHSAVSLKFLFSLMAPSPMSVAIIDLNVIMTHAAMHGQC